MSDPVRLRHHEDSAEDLRQSRKDLEAKVVRHIDAIRLEVSELVTDRLVAFLDRQKAIRLDVKESERLREDMREILHQFGKRLGALETLLGVDPHAPYDPEHPGTGNWRLPVPAAHSTAHRRNPPKPKPLDPVWVKETGAEVAQLEKDLPVDVTIRQLSEYFNVSYGRIQKLILKGLLEVKREGAGYLIPRAAVAAYVKIHGAPAPRTLFYDAAGVKFRK